MKRKKTKKAKKIKVFTLFSFSIIPLLVLFLGLFFFTSNSGFSVSKITSTLPYNEKWEVTPLTKEEKAPLEDIFSQTFIYLDSGTNSYSFVSQDGKYVLKFFKMKRLLPNKWLNHVPIPKILDGYKFEKVEKRDKNLGTLFESCKIAFEQLREETGLVYVHMNKTKEWKRKVHVIDNKQKQHFIDLDSIEFVVQKRVIPFEQRIAKLMQKEDTVRAKKAISSTLKLLADSCQKGIHFKEIKDNSLFLKNYGFVGDTAVFVDISAFEKIEDDMLSPSYYKTDILHAGARIVSWLKENHPEFVEDFLTEMDQYVQ